MEITHTMKYITMLLILIVSQNIYAQKDSQLGKALNNSIDLEKLIIGKWYVDPKDLSFKKSNAITIYSADHSVSYTAYTDTKCSKIRARVEATWEIKNNKLIITVVKATPPYRKPGYKIFDEIVSITSQQQVLKPIPDKGSLNYRTKVNTCSF